MLENKIKELINGLNGICSIIIHDLESNEKVFINEDLILPSASIIKYWILWKLYNEADKGRVDLNFKIPLNKKDKVGGFGVIQYLHEKLNLSLRDYATLMMIQSDNTATNILIDYLGMDAINNEIKALGMNQTLLQRKMMDEEAKKEGLDNFTSAKDTYKILMEIVEGERISPKYRREMLDIMFCQQCNNKLPLLLPPDVTFAHKTGDLPGTEHDAGILFVGNKKVVVVVMMHELKSNVEGIKLHNQIGSTIYNYFKFAN